MHRFEIGMITMITRDVTEEKICKRYRRGSRNRISTLIFIFTAFIVFLYILNDSNIGEVTVTGNTVTYSSEYPTSNRNNKQFGIRQLNDDYATQTIVTFYFDGYSELSGTGNTLTIRGTCTTDETLTCKVKFMNLSAFSPDINIYDYAYVNYTAMVFASEQDVVIKPKNGYFIVSINIIAETFEVEDFVIQIVPIDGINFFEIDQIQMHTYFSNISLPVISILGFLSAAVPAMLIIYNIGKNSEEDKKFQTECY